jgi:predicted tellurium resistance membrane protein TerC
METETVGTPVLWIGFAMLGLSALYFALADVMGKFQYLNVGLSLVLAFVGSKMLLAGIYEVPISVSLAAIITLLLGAVVASLLWSTKRPELPTQRYPSTRDQIAEVQR